MFHKFIVFSIIDPKDKVVPKLVECPHCGIVHRVTEIGESEVTTKENLVAIRRVEDIRASMPDNVVGVLESNRCDLPTWEEAEFIIDNKLWGGLVVISSEHMEENTHGKMIHFKAPGMIKVEAFSRADIIA